MRDLNILNGEIDEVNDQIDDFISMRFKLTPEIGKIKADIGSPAVDETREKQIIFRLIEKSKLLSVNPELIRSVFN